MSPCHDAEVELSQFECIADKGGNRFISVAALIGSCVKSLILRDGTFCGAAQLNDVTRTKWQIMSSATFVHLVLSIYFTMATRLNIASTTPELLDCL